MNRYKQLFGGLLVSTMVCGGVCAVEPDADVQGLWKDPTFQRQFLGTYGFQAELEPRVTQEERDQMEKVLAVMASDLDAARRQLEHLAKPDSGAIFDFTLGNVYFQQDKLDEAAACYRTAVTKFPSFRRAHKNLGLIFVRTSQFDDAIRSFTRAMELGGGDGLTYGLLGHAYASSEDYLSAESAYRSAVMLQPDNQDWKLGLARCIFKQQQYGEAAALLDELIQKHPERADFWLLQAHAWIGLKEPMKAAANYEFVSHLGKATVQTLNSLGDVYVNEGLWELAERAYLRALDLDPAQNLSRPLRAVEILATRGATAQAKNMISRIRATFANRIGESDRRKLLKLEARIVVGEGAGGEAAKILEEIIAVDPLDGEAIMLLAQHHAKAGSPEKAIFYYERAEGLVSFEAPAKLRHAQLLVGQSKFQEALPLLRRALEIKPQDDVARYLEQVERVAKSKR